MVYSNHPAGEGGRGADTPLRRDVQDQRMISKAIKLRWLNTDVLQNLAVVATAKTLSDEHATHRDKSRAVGNVIQMVGQNQKDEHADAGLLGTQVNVQVSVKEDEGWYSNDAHRLAAESASASVAGAPIVGPLQSGGQRPEVGQNGTGANGQH